MALPVSGKISLGDVNVELQLVRTAPVRMSNAAVRTLAAKPNGTIKMSDLRGKSHGAPANASAYQLTGGITANDYGETVGHWSFVTPVLGAISPASFQGYNVTGIYITYSTSDNGRQVTVVFSSNTAVPGANVKGITIGGFTFMSGLTNYPGTDKIGLASVQVFISAEQYNAIRAAILYQTTTAYIHY